MVDNTVVINDSCVGTDHPTLIIKNTIPETNFNPRNLLPANVADCTSLTGFTSNNNAVLSIENNSIKVNCNGSSQYQGFFISTNSIAKIEGDTDYTYSFYAKGSGTITISVWEYDANGNYITANCGTVQTLSSNPIRFIKTLKTTSATTRLNLLCYTSGAAQSVIYNISKTQLELSNTASEWMPGNLLTYNQQTVETDLTGIGKSGSGCTATLIRDTTEFYKGIASACVTLDSITNPASFYMGFYAFSANGTVKPGKTYIFNVKTKYVRNNHSNNIAGYLKIGWYDSANNNIGSTIYGASYFPKGSYETWTTKGVAPANAAYASIYLLIDNLQQPTNYIPVVGDKLYWDEAWLIEYPTDNLSIKNQLSVPEIQGNLLGPNQATGGDIYNSTFGMAQNRGTLSRDTTTMHSGTGSCKVTCNDSVYNTNIYPQLNIPVKPNTQYAASVWAKTDNVDANLKIGIYSYKSNGVSLGSVFSSPITASDWTKITYIFTTPAECSTINFAVNNTALTLGKSIWCDEAQLELGSVTEWKHPSIGPNKDIPIVTVKPMAIPEFTGKNLLRYSFATGGGSGYIGDLYAGSSKGILTIDNNNPILKNSIKCTITNGNGTGNSNIPNPVKVRCFPGEIYTYTIWVKSNVGTKTFGIYIDILNSSQLYLATFNSYINQSVGEWTKITKTFTIPTNGFYIVPYVLLVNPVNGDEYWLGKAQLEKSSVETEWVAPGVSDDLSIKNNLGITQLGTGLESLHISNYLLQIDSGSAIDLANVQVSAVLYEEGLGLDYTNIKGFILTGDNVYSGDELQITTKYIPVNDNTFSLEDILIQTNIDTLDSVLSDDRFDITALIPVDDISETEENIGITNFLSVFDFGITQEEIVKVTAAFMLKVVLNLERNYKTMLEKQKTVKVKLEKEIKSLVKINVRKLQ